MLSAHYNPPGQSDATQKELKIAMSSSSLVLISSSDATQKELKGRRAQGGTDVYGSYCAILEESL